MIITIKDKHTDDETDFSLRAYIDNTNIYVVAESTDGWQKSFIFKKEDYEISYIG